MRINPLLAEVLVGLTRQGRAQLDYLALLVVQAVVLFLWWPKSGVAQMLESQHGPDTLVAVVIAVGASMAYHALRAGAEEFVLPGQHGLRDWALGTPLRMGRILRGYALGQIAQSLHWLVLSSPLALVAFTVSGGEWRALAWCIAGALVQALFYRLSGAVTHLLIGQHRAECHFIVRTILVVVYVPVGWLVPFASHVALTSRALGEGVQTQPSFAGVPDPWAFVALYTGLSVILLFVLLLLLMRGRRGMAGPGGGASEAVMS